MDANALKRFQAQKRLGDAYLARQAAAQQSPTFLSFAEKWQAAQDEALNVAARVYRYNLSRKLRKGYTTGRFATGKAADSLRVRKAHNGHDGNRQSTVYTRDFKQRFWEFGGYNAFTRKFERKEYWRETMMESGQELAAAFHETFSRQLGA